jgi:hypothetical protein
VKRIPEDIWRNGRRSDEITPKIAEIALQYLLVEKNERFKAKDLYVEMKNVIFGARPTTPTNPTTRLSTMSMPQRVSSSSFVASPETIQAPFTNGAPSSASFDRSNVSHQYPTASTMSPETLHASTKNEPTFSYPPSRPSGSEKRPVGSNAWESTNEAGQHQQPLFGGLNVVTGQPNSVHWPPLAVASPGSFQPSQISREEKEPAFTIDDFEYWFPRRKGIRPEPPGLDQVRGLIKCRDFVFIIDNSRSMQGKKREVLRHVKCQAYLAKNIDPDGFQIMCTSKPTEMKKCKTSTQACDFVEKIFTDGREASCNIEIALCHVIDDIEDKLQSRRRSRYSLTQLVSETKKVTIIVFTDGVWDTSMSSPEDEQGLSLYGVDVLIERCIKMMKDRGIGRPNVAFQFLQFGSDARGKERLRIFDDELEKKPENRNFDIVDHKTTDDGIYDILIGPVHPHVDGKYR